MPKPKKETISTINWKEMFVKAVIHVAEDIVSAMAIYGLQLLIDYIARH